MSQRKLRRSAIALMTVAGGLAIASASAVAAERPGKVGFPCNGIRSSRAGVMNCNARNRKDTPNGGTGTRGYLDCNGRTRKGFLLCNGRTRKGYLNCDARTKPRQ
jgi:hypothetical protein